MTKNSDYLHWKILIRLAFTFCSLACWRIRCLLKFTCNARCLVRSSNSRSKRSSGSLGVRYLAARKWWLSRARNTPVCTRILIRLQVNSAKVARLCRLWTHTISERSLVNRSVGLEMAEQSTIRQREDCKVSDICCGRPALWIREPEREWIDSAALSEWKKRHRLITRHSEMFGNKLVVAASGNINKSLQPSWFSRIIPFRIAEHSYSYTLSAVCVLHRNLQASERFWTTASGLLFGNRFVYKFKESFSWSSAIEWKMIKRDLEINSPN